MKDRILFFISAILLIVMANLGFGQNNPFSVKTKTVKQAGFMPNPVLPLPGLASHR
jgi:hypothetical protein